MIIFDLSNSELEENLKYKWENITEGEEAFFKFYDDDFDIDFSKF